jgi:hypothetical protein
MRSLNWPPTFEDDVTDPLRDEREGVGRIAHVHDYEAADSRIEKSAWFNGTRVTLLKCNVGYC